MPMKLQDSNQFQNEFVAAVRPLVLAKFPGTNSGPENQTNK